MFKRVAIAAYMAALAVGALAGLRISQAIDTCNVGFPNVGMMTRCVAWNAVYQEDGR